MHDLKDILEDIIPVLEEIEECYLKLSELENNGEYDTLEYNYYFSLLNMNINKEKHFYMNLSKSDNLYELWSKLNKRYNNNSQNIVLGKYDHSYFYRIKNVIDYIIGDEVLMYAHILKTDAYKVVLIMLNALISNPYYKDIKEDLIDFKYNIYYLNADLEDTFLNGNSMDIAKLSINEERNDSFLGYKYIDIAILIYESKKIIDYLMNFNSDLENKEIYSKVVIKILILFANLTLCEEDTLKEVYTGLVNILENEELHLELKETLEQLMQVLLEEKDKITLERM